MKLSAQLLMESTAIREGAGACFADFASVAVVGAAHLLRPHVLRN